MAVSLLDIHDMAVCVSRLKKKEMFADEPGGEFTRKYISQILHANLYRDTSLDKKQEKSNTRAVVRRDRV